MTRSRLSLLTLTAGLVIVGGCRPADSPTLESGQPFHGALLRTAGEYKAWGRVDDPTRFSPYYCRMPPPAQAPPAQARFSGSQDTDTHGQKLYYLFAKDRTAYLGPTDQGAAVGQVIVKESWTPEEVKDMKPGGTDWAKVIRTPEIGPDGTDFYPYATKGDKVYRAVKPTGLFIMLKLDPITRGTDDGWVYGTVSADGKTVTSAGKVESCMKCHQDAKHDRLFGLPSK
jgi:hypothetical protein